jgi:hypothetical protein
MTAICVLAWCLTAVSNVISLHPMNGTPVVETEFYQFATQAECEAVKKYIQPGVSRYVKWETISAVCTKSTPVPKSGE